MHVQNCFHPKTIYNPYTGEKIVTRCGKCAACLNSRAAQWIQRLDLESTCHKYTLFVTLTYDDFNVPQFVRMRKDDYPEPAYIDSETGVIISAHDIRAQFDRSDWDYISDTKVLNVLHKKDFQDFFKRLRYYFYECDKAKLRYYLGAEYGPRTYRPHGHLLLFFDSELCLQRIEEFLSKAWPFGNCYDPHLVSGSAADYCAAYINGLFSLPKIYLHGEIRPFSLFSKSPSIGSGAALSENVRESIVRGDNTMSTFQVSSRTFENVPLWRSIEARRFPRLPRFGSLSHDDRVTLYKLSQELGEISCVDFARYIEHVFVKTRTDTFLSRYFNEISRKYVFAYHFFDAKKDLPKDLQALPFLPKNYTIPSDLQAVKSLSREYCFDSLLRFCRILSVFAHNMETFGFSCEEYVGYIENYYEKKYKKKVKEDYKFQDEYFAENPLWHYVYFDKSFYDLVTTTDASSWSDGVHSTLLYLFEDTIPYKEINGGKEIITVLDIPPIEALPDFSHFVKLHTKIAHDLVKTKENNDYALQHKDKFGNIIKYQNL